MGFNEDDRIRAKNRIYNIAYEEYQQLKGFLKPSDEEIVSLCDRMLSVADSYPRREIIFAIQKIARSSNVEQNSNN